LRLRSPAPATGWEEKKKDVFPGIMPPKDMEFVTEEPSAGDLFNLINSI
jgi:hypothetical protein